MFRGQMNTFFLLTDDVQLWPITCQISITFKYIFQSCQPVSRKTKTKPNLGRRSIWHVSMCHRVNMGNRLKMNADDNIWIWNQTQSSNRSEYFHFWISEIFKWINFWLLKWLAMLSKLSPCHIQRQHKSSIPPSFTPNDPLTITKKKKSLPKSPKSTTLSTYSTFFHRRHQLLDG